VFLRVKSVKHVVPVHISQIDDVVEMLNRGKRVIAAFEGRES